MLICRECPGKAKAIRKEVTRRLRAAGIRDVRALVTSCQDLCPKHGTAVSVVAAAQPVRTYVVRRTGDPDALAGEIVRLVTHPEDGAAPSGVPRTAPRRGSSEELA